MCCPTTTQYGPSSIARMTVIAAYHHLTQRSILSPSRFNPANIADQSPSTFPSIQDFHTCIPQPKHIVDFPTLRAAIRHTTHVLSQAFLARRSFLIRMIPATRLGAHTIPSIAITAFYLASKLDFPLCYFRGGRQQRAAATAAAPQSCNEETPR